MFQDDALRCLNKFSSPLQTCHWPSKKERGYNKTCWKITGILVQVVEIIKQIYMETCDNYITANLTKLAFRFLNKEVCHLPLLGFLMHEETLNWYLPCPSVTWWFACCFCNHLKLAALSVWCHLSYKNNTTLNAKNLSQTRLNWPRKNY